MYFLNGLTLMAVFSFKVVLIMLLAANPGWSLIQSDKDAVPALVSKLATCSSPDMFTKLFHRNLTKRKPVKKSHLVRLNWRSDLDRNSVRICPLAQDFKL